MSKIYVDHVVTHHAYHSCELHIATYICSPCCDSSMHTSHVETYIVHILANHVSTHHDYNAVYTHDGMQLNICLRTIKFEMGIVTSIEALKTNNYIATLIRNGAVETLTTSKTVAKDAVEKTEIKGKVSEIAVNDISGFFEGTNGTKIKISQKTSMKAVLETAYSAALMSKNGMSKYSNLISAEMSGMSEEKTYEHEKADFTDPEYVLRTFLAKTEFSNPSFNFDYQCITYAEPITNEELTKQVYEEMFNMITLAYNYLDKAQRTSFPTASLANIANFYNDYIKGRITAKDKYKSDVQAAYDKFQAANNEYEDKMEAVNSIAETDDHKNDMNIFNKIKTYYERMYNTYLKKNDIRFRDKNKEYYEVNLSMFNTWSSINDASSLASKFEQAYTTLIPQGEEQASRLLNFISTKIDITSAESSGDDNFDEYKKMVKDNQFVKLKWGMYMYEILANAIKERLQNLGQYLLTTYYNNVFEISGIDKFVAMTDAGVACYLSYVDSSVVDMAIAKVRNSVINGVFNKQMIVFIKIIVELMAYSKGYINVLESSITTASNLLNEYQNGYEYMYKEWNAARTNNVLTGEYARYIACNNPYMYVCKQCSYTLRPLIAIEILKKVYGEKAFMNMQVQKFLLDNCDDDWVMKIGLTTDEYDKWSKIPKTTKEVEVDDVDENGNVKMDEDGNAIKVKKQVVVAKEPSKPIGDEYAKDWIHVYAFDDILRTLEEGYSKNIEKKVENIEKAVETITNNIDYSLSLTALNILKNVFVFSNKNARININQSNNVDVLVNIEFKTAAAEASLIPKSNVELESSTNRQPAGDTSGSQSGSQSGEQAGSPSKSEPTTVEKGGLDKKMTIIIIVVVIVVFVIIVLAIVLALVFIKKKKDNQRQSEDQLMLNDEDVVEDVVEDVDEDVDEQDVSIDA